MKYLFWSLLLIFGGCSGCAIMGESEEARLIDEIADHCKHGLKYSSVKKDGREIEVRGECAGYGL